MNPTNFPGRKKLRKEEGVVRQAACDRLTPVERLARLDLRLGAGVGAVKERARLAKLLVVKAPNETTADETKKPQKASKNRTKAKTK